MAGASEVISATVPRWYWPLCIFLASLFFGALYFADSGDADPPGERLTRGRWLLSDALIPPGQDDAWSEWTSLPQPISTYPDRASVWYELDVADALRITGDRRGDGLAVYLPTPAGNATVFVNNTLVGGGGSRLPPVAHHTAPLLFEIPANVLADSTASAGDTNTGTRLLVHRTHMDGNGRLPAVYLGPVQPFEGDFRRLKLLRQWIPFGILVCTLILNVIMAVLFALRRHDTIYGWYALMLFFWATYQAWNLAYAPVFKNPFLWRSISYVSLGLFVSASVVFVHRFLDRQPKVFERALKAWSAAGSLLLVGLAAGGSLLYVRFGLFIWIPIANALGLYTLVLLGRDTYLEPTRARLYLLAVAGIVVLAGLRDFVWDLGIGLPGTTYYVGYTAGLVLVVFSVFLLMRFIHALNEADELRAHLSLMVDRKTQQLEENFARLRQVEREQAVSEERERIMRDMHDGLGGQLIRALAMSEQGSDKDLETALRYALDDLRLIVDSLSPNHNGLLELIAAYRHRVSKLASRIDTEIVWDIAPDFPDLELNPQKALNVLRILQEALSNAIQHAQCQRIQVSLSQTGAAVVLKVADDGHGASPNTQGRGLQNMRVRAREIGAELDVGFSPTGTVVTCRLPTG